MPRKKRQQKKTKQNDDNIDDIDLLINNYCNNQVFVIRHYNEENYDLIKQHQHHQLSSSASSSCSSACSGSSCSSSGIQKFTKNYFENFEIPQKQQCMNKKKMKRKKNNNKHVAIASDHRSTNNNNIINDNNNETTTIIESKKSKKETPKKAVSFSTVSISEYKRGLSVDAIPNDGSNYPLGLTNTIIRSYKYDNINDFENERQQILHDRLNEYNHKLAKKKKKQSKKDNNKHHNDVDITITSSTDMLASYGDMLETRQWDFKNTDHSNPLFKPLKELQRKDIFIRDLITSNTTTDTNDLDKDHPVNAATRQQPLRKSKNKKNHNLSSSSSSSSSNKLPFTLNELDTIHQSVTQIHKERTYNTESRGCNCHIKQTCHKTLRKKIKHYSMHKLIEELNERSLIDNNTSLTREEMESLLMHELENIDITPCCSSNNDCDCQRNGIQCHVLYCNCCTIPTKPNKKLKELIENNDRDDFYRLICGNKYGIYTVNESKIQLHYDKMLSRSANIAIAYQ